MYKHSFNVLGNNKHPLTTQKGLVHLLSDQLLCIHEMVKVLVPSKKCNSSLILQSVSFACNNSVLQRLGTTFTIHRSYLSMGRWGRCRLLRYVWLRSNMRNVMGDEWMLTPSRQKLSATFSFSQIWCNFHPQSFT